MLNRNNLFLVGLLVIQMIALAVTVVTSTGSEAREIESIVANMNAEVVERISIADDAGTSLTFARSDAGWVLPDADDFPVNGERVDEILDMILSLDTRRLVAANPANFARLEVKDDDFRRKLTLESGEQSALLFLGGSGGVDTVYTRRAGEDEVYLGFGLSAWELATGAATWVNTSYVSVPQIDVLEMTVHNAQGAFTFLRDGETWIYTDLPEGATFEDTKLPSLLRNATSVTLLAPLGVEALDEYGLEEPPVTVDLRYRQILESAPADDESADSESEAGSDDGAETEADLAPIEYSEMSYTLSLGAEMEAGVVAKASDAEYFVLLRDTVLSAFSDISHDDFIRLPEPESEADASAGE